MGGQVGHVPGEGREERTGREGLCPACPRGVLPVPRVSCPPGKGRCVTPLCGSQHSAGSAVHTRLGRVAGGLFSRG